MKYICKGALNFKLAFLCAIQYSVWQHWLVDDSTTVNGIYAEMSFKDQQCFLVLNFVLSKLLF